jgi:hypothetical protein
MDLLQVKTDTGHFWDSLAPVSCLFNLLLSGVVEALGDALPAPGGKPTITTRVWSIRTLKERSYARRE